MLSFGQEGESFGMLAGLCGVAVNDQDEIAVTECGNHRVSVFSTDGTHLRWFGWEGQNNGAFQFPSWIAFDSLGNIVVPPRPPAPPPPKKNIVLADCDNHRVQVFDTNGNFVSRFGELGSLDNQLSDPEGLSINGKDNINVADRDNKLIKTFSSSGKYLRKFGGASSLVNPCHCIQQGQYFYSLRGNQFCSIILFRHFDMSKLVVFLVMFYL